MSTKKKTKPASKKPSNANTAKPKPSPKKPNPRGRKLGERVEKIRERLSLSQIEEERKTVCDLWRQRDELDEKRKASAADYKAKIADVQKQVKQALGNAQSGYRDLEIVVEEWLTPQNQVQRYRTDTGELIGDRAPRSEDLQESLPGIEPAEPDEEEDEGDETDEEGEKLAEEVAEVAKDMAAAGDFGE